MFPFVSFCVLMLEIPVCVWLLWTVFLTLPLYVMYVKMTSNPLHHYYLYRSVIWRCLVYLVVIFCVFALPDGQFSVCFLYLMAIFSVFALLDGHSLHFYCTWWSFSVCLLYLMVIFLCVWLPGDYSVCVCPTWWSFSVCLLYLLVIFSVCLRAWWSFSLCLF